MGVSVSGNDILEYCAEFRRMKERISQQLDEVNNAITKYMSMSSFRGASAESTKNYMQEIHVQTLIPLLKAVMEEYELKILRYAYLYIEKENQEDFYLSEDVINQARSDLDTEYLEAIGDACNDYCNSISDLMETEDMRPNELCNDYARMKFRLSNLLSNIDSSESSVKAGDLNNVTEYINNADNAIINGISRSPDFMTSYIPGDYVHIQGFLNASNLLSVINSDLSSGDNQIIKNKLNNYITSRINHNIATEKVKAAEEHALKMREKAGADMNEVISMALDLSKIPFLIKNEIMDEDRNSMMDKIKALIPDSSNNKSVLRFFELLRKMNRGSLSADLILEHYTKNKDIIASLPGYPFMNSDGYIINQSSNVFKDILYGKNSDINYSGCEIIAVYNAIQSIGKDSISIDKFPELISTFETEGAVLGGRFGTSPDAIEDYFNTLDGYSAELTSDVDSAYKVDNFCKNYKTIIATFYNNGNDISEGVHTVCIVYDKKDKNYKAYNLYNLDKTSKNRNITEIENVSDVFSSKRKCISLIGIKGE